MLKYLYFIKICLFLPKLDMYIFYKIYVILPASEPIQNEYFA